MKAESTLYAIKKEGGMWHVVTKSRGITQFKNTRKSWCEEWIIQNDPALKALMEAAEA